MVDTRDLKSAVSKSSRADEKAHIQGIFFKNGCALHFALPDFQLYISAGVVEQVDTLHLKCNGNSRAGSSPAIGTTFWKLSEFLLP